MARNHSCHVCANSPVASAQVSISSATRNETTTQTRIWRVTTMQTNRHNRMQKEVFAVQTKHRHLYISIKPSPVPRSHHRHHHRSPGIVHTAWMYRCARDTAAVAAATAENRRETTKTTTSC